MGIKIYEKNRRRRSGTFRIWIISAVPAIDVQEANESGTDFSEDNYIDNISEFLA